MNRFFVVLFFMIMFTYNLFAQRENILVIESYHAQYPWDKSYKEGLREILASKYNLIFFEMNTKRIDKKHYEKMANLAWKKYKEVRPSLVILGDDNALKYLGYRFAKTNTKVVYLGINNNPRNYFISG
ncbi:MAG: sugar ABC transporter, partial [Campylobacteraceae bacterium]|nr:sugar ABC transporter [Campylobacteraceae bacterium]